MFKTGQDDVVSVVLPLTDNQDCSYERKLKKMESFSLVPGVKTFIGMIGRVSSPTVAGSTIKISGSAGGLMSQWDPSSGQIRITRELRGNTPKRVPSWSLLGIFHLLWQHIFAGLLTQPLKVN